MKLFWYALVIFLGSPDALGNSGLDALRKRMRAWSVMCEGSAAKEECDDGDSMLWNGLLCLSGQEPWACDAVMRSQDDDGRLWRSPRRVNADKKNSFSRDMAFGALAYLAHTRDLDLGNRWFRYIARHRRLCPDAVDGRCFLTPMIWTTLNRVAAHIGMSPLPNFFKEAPDTQKLPRWDDAELVLEARHTPLGYRLHLVSLELLLRKEIGLTSDLLDEAAAVLARRQPENPYFVWLAGGAPETVTERILAIAPQEVPMERREWSWERDTDGSPWLRSMGWEFVWLANMVLRTTNVNHQVPMAEAVSQYESDLPCDAPPHSDSFPVPTGESSNR